MKFESKEGKVIRIMFAVKPKIGNFMSFRCLLRSSERGKSDLVTSNFLDDQKIAVITLNNPSKLNALTEPMGDQLTAHVTELKNKTIRAAIITGAGKAFSAGGDLDWLLQRHRDTPDNNIQIMQQFYQRFLVLRTLEVPIIAAINGAAVGAGFCLALGGADIRVASSQAKMGLTFTKLGLHPGMAATHFLPQLAGPQVAAELLLTGRLVTAGEAVSMGLVARQADDALEASLTIARDICNSAPIAVRTTLETLRSKQDLGLDQAYRREATAQAECYPSQDLKEGVTALQEKRKPVFTGN
ncbi:3-hydroxybutyryl-CoA dehydratase-like protein, mitochondrial [Eurytemora carolleeae]|uniref:3-hydroxybutyryl-CoA dehydratase-like protein, mitochondrial n=1 Tax=Eurytemora carolleeae TaxID=1294199 RepID=UPI000C768E18|nr:3-hydroxybutyryl-CoA dehydratase-like protein, mitochondrial [Eurytemora carolleeae]|eukprot:XP_023326237.1 3-hydroxybutyryl-CoA dehydratase-like protein, mitochondrial [Eurytemora affinis]